jgi:hypothetical protein
MQTFPCCLQLRVCLRTVESETVGPWEMLDPFGVWLFEHFPDLRGRLGMEEPTSPESSVLALLLILASF